MADPTEADLRKAAGLPLEESEADLRKAAGLPPESEAELRKAAGLPPEDQADTSWGSYGKVGLASLAKGATDVAGAIASGLSALPRAAIGGRDPDLVTDIGLDPYLPKPLDPGLATRKAGETIGGWPALDTPAKQRLDVAGRFVAPTVATMGEGFLPKVVGAVTHGAIPGYLSEWARQKTEGTKYKDLPGGSWLPEKLGEKEISPDVAMATSLFSPKLPKTVISPSAGKIDPFRKEAADIAARESGGTFKATAGQILDDPAQMNEEWRAPREAGPRLNKEQQDAVMRTATAHTGDPVTNVTYGMPTDWVNRNATRIGNDIDNLERNTFIKHPIGNTVLPNGNKTYAYPEFSNIGMNLATSRPQDLSGILHVIEQTSARLKPSASALPGESIHDALFNSIGTRQLNGAEYKQLRYNLHSAAAGATNPQSAYAYKQVANALDNAMGGMGQGWGQAWNRSRREYANHKVFENLSATKGKGGERQQWTPAEIAQASERVMGKEPWIRGELENSPFISRASIFKPLKERKIPETYPPYQNIPVLGPLMGHAANWAPYAKAAGALAASHLLGAQGWQVPLDAAILGAIVAKHQNKVRPVFNPMGRIAQARQKSTLVPQDNPVQRALRTILAGPASPSNQPQNNQ